MKAKGIDKMVLCQNKTIEPVIRTFQSGWAASRLSKTMTVRNLSPATQRSYISAVSKFSRYFGRSPDRLELEDVRAFQVHLASTGISWGDW